MSRHYGDGPYGIPGTQGVAVTPGNPVGGGGAAINMPTRASMAGQGTALPPYMRVPVWPPQLLLSTNRLVGHQTRDYTGGVLNAALNAEAVAAIQFDIPCIIYALTASAVTTDQAVFVNGLTPLDSFLIALEHSNGDRLTAGQARLGSTICGSAQRPRMVGGNGWVFDRGSTLIVRITPLQANLRIDFVVETIEERGPTNIAR
jgi:hypothetical protein